MTGIDVQVRAVLHALDGNRLSITAVRKVSIDWARVRPRVLQVRPDAEAALRDLGYRPLESPAPEPPDCLVPRRERPCSSPPRDGPGSTVMTPSRAVYAAALLRGELEAKQVNGRWYVSRVPLDRYFAANGLSRFRGTQASLLEQLRALLAGALVPVGWIVKQIEAAGEEDPARTIPRRSDSGRRCTRARPRTFDRTGVVRW